MLGCKKAYPVYADETIELFDPISVSAGQRGTQILLNPQDYPQPNKADVNSKDNLGLTPLHYAAEKDRKDVAELLFAKSNDVSTHLTYAVTNKSLKVAQLLRQHGGHE